jgi:poly-gamma-glutamate capsule biosynthesis protein CapA/YwtB (metallophosphatase superfamily)
VVERQGIRFGIAAFGHNSYTLKHTNPATVKTILDTLSKISDIVIVSFHGGAEGSDKGHLPEGPESYLGENRGNLRAFAHQCIELGADLVYGHGPHVTRCVEVYKGRLIAYSLGNFCTPYGMNLAGVNGYAPVVTIRINDTGKFLDGDIHSFIQIRGKGPQPDENKMVVKEIRQLIATDIKDSKINIDDNGKIKLK